VRQMNKRKAYPRLKESCFQEFTLASIYPNTVKAEGIECFD